MRETVADDRVMPSSGPPALFECPGALHVADDGDVVGKERFRERPGATEAERSFGMSADDSARLDARLMRIYRQVLPWRRSDVRLMLIGRSRTQARASGTAP